MRSDATRARLDAALEGPRHALPEGASTPEEIQAALDALSALKGNSND